MSHTAGPTQNKLAKIIVEVLYDSMDDKKNLDIALKTTWLGEHFATRANFEPITSRREEARELCGSYDYKSRHATLRQFHEKTRLSRCLQIRALVALDQCDPYLYICTKPANLCTIYLTKWYLWTEGRVATCSENLGIIRPPHWITADFLNSVTDPHERQAKETL